jgi:hypothetical protein
VRTLRVLNGLLGVLVVVAAATGSRPEVFRFLLPAGVLLFVIGCGCIAGDAVPLRPVPLLCSVGGTALGLLLIARGGPAELLGAAVVVLQAVAWRASRTAPAALGAPPDGPRPQRARVQ